MASLSLLLKRLTSSKFSRDLVSLYIIFAVNALLPLVNTPYLARTLGPSGLGLLAFFQGIGSISIIAIEFGFGYSASRELSREGHEHDFRADTLSRVFGAKLMLSLIPSAAMSVAAIYIPILRTHPLMLALTLIWGVAGGMNLNWYFQGVGQLPLQGVIETLSRLSAVALIFTFVRSTSDAWLVLLLNGAASLCSMLIGLVVISRNTSLQRPSFQNGWRAIKVGWPLFLYRAALSVCTAGSGVILGFLSTAAAVGYYSGAEKIIRGLISLSQPLTQLLYSDVNSRMRTGLEEARKAFLKGAAILVPSTLLMALAVVLFGKQMVLLFLGSKFGPSLSVLQVLAILPALGGITMLLGIQWMVPLGLEKTFTKICLLTALVNLMLATLMAARFREIGVAYAIVASEVFAASLCFAVLSRKGLNPFRKIAVSQREAYDIAIVPSASTDELVLSSGESGA